MSVIEFTSLVVKNSDYLKPFAFTLTKDSEIAKDLLQETVYKALVNKDKFNSGTNIKAWLYTILRNIFINDYRKKSKYKTVELKTAYPFPNDYFNGSVNNLGVVNLNAQEIKTAIYQLPHAYKFPLELYIEGYKYEEIATMLNEPIGTIKSRIHLARKLLKDKIVLN